MTHHALIVTSNTKETIAKIREKCVNISLAYCDGFDRPPFQVSPITPESSNFYQSFLIAPDGSKPSFPQSANGDAAREQIKTMLREGEYRVDWVEIRFGQADMFDWEPLPRYGEVIDGRGYTALDEDDNEIRLPIEAESPFGLKVAKMQFSKPTIEAVQVTADEFDHEARLALMDAEGSNFTLDQVKAVAQRLAQVYNRAFKDGSSYASRETR
jgi:hypothetical protein